MRGNEDHGRSAVLQHGEHSARACCCSRSPASDRSSRGAGRRWRTSSASSLAPAIVGVVVGVAAASRSACATSTRSSPTRSCGFVAGTIVQEFYKGVGARQRDARRVACRSRFVRLVARNRRRYGGYIVHAGHRDAVRGVRRARVQEGVRRHAQAPARRTSATDPYGHQWKFVSQGVSRYDALNREVTARRPRGVPRRQARRASSRARSGSTSTAAAAPTFEPSTEVGIHGVVQAGRLRRARRRARRRRRRSCASPSIRSCVWVWIGGALMAIGGLIVMWPQAEQAARAGRLRGGDAAGRRSGEQVPAPLMTDVTRRFSPAPPLARRRCCCGSRAALRAQRG